MSAFQENIGAFLKAIPVLGSTAAISLSSDGAPNATELAGRIIDLSSTGLGNKRHLSAKLVVVVDVSTTGANAGTGKITSRVLHATSTSTADMAALGSTGVVTTFGTTTTSTSYSAVHEQDINLRTARRYIQVCITPNFVASSSGAFRYHASLLLGGGDETPSTALGAAVRVG